MVPLPVKIPELSTLVAEGKHKMFQQPSKSPFRILGDADREGARDHPTRKFVLNGITFSEYQHDMAGGGMLTVLKTKPPQTSTPGSIFDDLFQSITWAANMTGEISLVRHPMQSRAAGSRNNRYEALFGPREDATTSAPVTPYAAAPVAVQAVIGFLGEVLTKLEILKDSRKRFETETISEAFGAPSQVVVAAFAGGEQDEGFKPVAYHGEADTTITLCLGSPVRARWRYNSKNWNHNDGRKPLDEGDLEDDTKHVEVPRELTQGRRLRSKQHEKHKNEILKPQTSSGAGNAPDAITSALGHGDILISQGRALAERVETAVELHGSLHLRLTMFVVSDNNGSESEEGLKKSCKGNQGNPAAGVPNSDLEDVGTQTSYRS
ncbi:hypothetical protein QBC42DRAFT_287752 [Cladorrhinum samala]|uniref:Uncharacterized protein n=1 Tax=Cladorrhinum samala TaxID=585594 RepID=A0AAV9HKH4_9PEZI|nr:hypothetical protein QBC42DRAFT_287752 [Cladorrhinum samala]